MNRRIQPWRWLAKAVQISAALAIPFIRIGGASALRFDVPAQKLYFFGAVVWMDEFFVVLIALLFISFLVVLLTILLGRVWCGWLCPQTIVADITSFVDRMHSRRWGFRVVSVIAVLAVSTLLAADCLWYFVEPSQFFGGIIEGKMGPVVAWSWASLTAVTFVNFLFVRRTFCRTVCPYAKLQGALFDDRTLIIANETGRMNECMHCDACVRACPVGIDIRKGLQVECVACAECIDACSRQMDRRGKTSLITYRFGDTAAGGLCRRSVVLSALLTGVFLVLLVILIVFRGPVEMDIAADASARVVRDARGDVINTYVLSLTNRGRDVRTVFISVTAAGGPVVAVPATISLGPGEHRRVHFTLRTEGRERLLKSPERVMITATVSGPGSERLEQSADMLPPW